MRRLPLGACIGAAAMAIAMLIPVPAQAGQGFTYDGTAVKGGNHVLVSCYIYGTSTSTWRSDRLPLAGTWVYRDGGKPGIAPDHAGEVQCAGRVWSKGGKLVGYTTPVSWRFLP